MRSHRPGRRPAARAAAGLRVRSSSARVAASRFFALAASPGEIDEAVFAGAVTRFDLFDLSPQAPGFPVWILLGRALLPFCVTPFNALATASTVLAAVARSRALRLGAAGRRRLGGARGRRLRGVALPGRLGQRRARLLGHAGDGPASSARSRASRLPRSGARRTRRAGARCRRAARAPPRARGGPSRRRGLPASGRTSSSPSVRRSSSSDVPPRVPRWDRRDAVVSFVGAALAGTAAWVVWLFAQAGGAPGLFASLSERAGFRAHAFATGTVGTLLDSFLVRDFLSPRRAALVVLVVAAVGPRRARDPEAPRRASTSSLVLVPTLPLALVPPQPRDVALLGPVRARPRARRRRGARGASSGRGRSRSARRSLAAGFFAREAWPDVVTSAHEETPPIAAIRDARALRPPGPRDDRGGRGLPRLPPDGAVGGPARRLGLHGRGVRLGAAPDEQAARPPRGLHGRARAARPPRPALEDVVPRRPCGRERSATAASSPSPCATRRRRSSARASASKESAPGRPSFRWAGPSARLLVAGGPGPALGDALGRAARPRPARRRSPSRRPARGGVLVSRAVAPGPFDLTIVDRPVFGPMPGPAEYVISCDRPVDLPPARRRDAAREGLLHVPRGDVLASARSALDAAGRAARGRPRGAGRRPLRPRRASGAREDRGHGPRPPLDDRRARVVLLGARARLRSGARRPPRARGRGRPKDVAIYVNGVLAADACASGRASPRRLGASPAGGRGSPRGPRAARGSSSARRRTVPKAPATGDDTRALGVAVDRIAFE